MELFVWFFLIGVALWSAWRIFDLKAKWRYFRMDTRQKIEFLSQKINQESDISYQKMLLERVKLLAKKYRVEQEKIVHPNPSEVNKWFYNPYSRAFLVAMALIVTYCFLFYGADDVLAKVKDALVLDKDATALSTVVIALFTVIPATLLWWFRDLNNYKERETAHRDVIFSEHKQLVEWASTEVKPEDSNSTATQTTEINPLMIQVAGIYQLAPFLKDHHANLYQRSTLETLRAIVNAGRPRWEQWIKDYEDWILGYKKEEPEKPVLTAAERAVHAVLREKPVLFYHNHFNAKDFNLAGFDGRGLVLIGCNFQETMLVDADFSGANLTSARFDKAVLLGSNFSRCSLVDVSFSEANLILANFFNQPIYKFPKLDTGCFRMNRFTFTGFSIANLRFSNLLRVMMKESFVSIRGAIVSEPNLVETEPELCKFAKDAIRKGAISIADEKIKDHPLFEFIEGEHDIAIHELKYKGLTPTTQASLAAEPKETP